MNQQDKEAIIANYISTPAGRSRLAQAMRNPILRDICPICKIRYSNLQDHCNAVGDDLHVILSVQEV
jgi:hypothetical protein